MQPTTRRGQRHLLRRSIDGRLVAGVAGGLADHLDVDVVVVRIAFVVLALLGGIALPLYLAAWLLVPEEGSDGCVAAELLGRHGPDAMHRPADGPTGDPSRGRDGVTIS